MREIVASLTARNRAEAYHDAVAKKEEALQMFRLGMIGLAGARRRRDASSGSWPGRSPS